MADYILEAHRGVSKEYPDNTMAAYRAAKELGYGMIELDTKFTSDRKCVLLHDRTINRTARYSDGSEITDKTEIKNITLEKAREFDYGIYKDIRFKGEKIPTLDEVVTFAVENDIPLKFDNVAESHTGAELAVFVDTIKTITKDRTDIAQFTCSDIPYARLMRTVFPSCHIHYDGSATDEAIKELSSFIPKSELTIWMRFDNKATSWNTTPPVSIEMAEKIHSVASLGVWILSTKEELSDAVNLYHADIIETDGSIRP